MSMTSPSFAAEGERLSREAFQRVEQAENATRDTMHAAGNGMLSGVEAVRAFHFKLAEIIGANVMASWDLAMRLAAVKSPGDAFELWAKFAKQQLDRHSEQYLELADIGQKFAASARRSGFVAPSIVND